MWGRLAAVAPIRPLAWKPPYAVDAALKRQNKKKKKKKKEQVSGTLKGLFCPVPAQALRRPPEDTVKHSAWVSLPGGETGDPW